ncbi:hypothetical protein SERLADRAFT_464408 [Serpula lacrymans var. lacrymans S7.9]|uniref:Uncharacterized protein n=1 Tax=Serpula lacrymans var. lacrymans (strain S7.9) TaxID=578457 RepID=F8NS27_SERL9|nr:uncharacterized protein SERLADRAFT_464408 [Serpula lacrymans var. lacrymans S7.9]EGO26860.1 hypothetical protein SERLADRAFT_464408 [Serpula lacrymans var. lacrymans S7.9]
MPALPKTCPSGNSQYILWTYIPHNGDQKRNCHTVFRAEMRRVIWKVLNLLTLRGFPKASRVRTKPACGTRFNY